MPQLAAAIGTASISGTVSGPDGPLAGGCVDVYAAGSGAEPISRATAAADGGYELGGLAAGDYKIRFHDCGAGAVVAQFHANKASFASADPVSLVEGEVRTGVNAALAPDTTAPETTITGRPGAVVNTDTVMFEFESDDPTARFECRFDGGAYYGCASGDSSPELSDGSHTFEVRAIGGSGNPDPSPATHTFTVDADLPETTIDSGPAEGEVVSIDSVSFHFSSSRPEASFVCKLNGGEPLPCSSPKAYTDLAEGPHTFSVYSSVDGGLSEPFPGKVRSFTVNTGVPDTRPPQTTIISGPSNPHRSDSASFGFASSEVGSSFACRLDGVDAGFVPCVSPREYVGLADGAYTFNVRAADAAGNSDASPAQLSFTVDTSDLPPDTTPPTTTITDGPGPTIDSDSTVLRFASNEPDSTFACRLREVDPDFTPCGSPQPYANLANGPYRFEVKATDSSGNVEVEPAVWTFNVDDQTAPQTTIEGPEGATSSSSPTFSFTATEAGSTFECSLDGEPFSSCSSPRAVPALAEGSHTLEVRATDSNGNTEEPPASRSFTVDTVAPETVIDSGPAGPVTSGPAQFSFSSPADGGSEVGFECRIDTAEFAPCASPAGYDLADGDHLFEVRGIDAAGNRDATPARHAFTVDRPPPPDTTAPRVTITGGPTGTIGTRSASFSFSSNEAGTFECRMDGAGFSGCASPKGYSSLGDGTHTFHVRAIDGAGNVSTVASRSFTVQIAPPPPPPPAPDTTPPETTIDTGPGATISSDSATFTFSSSEPDSTFECKLGASPFRPCTSPKAYDGLSEGTLGFSVRAIDAAGNVDPTPAMQTLTVRPPSSGGPGDPADPGNPGSACKEAKAKKKQAAAKLKKAKQANDKAKIRKAKQKLKKAKAKVRRACR